MTSAAPNAGASPVAFGGGADIGLWTALALAFFGGALLNLMPCVFPVLSIKLIGLAQQRGDRYSLRAHALAYAAGVVLSFLALAAGLLALRAAGSAIGWGFQLQEPGVVFVLALLFFALGLNLMGAFEFGNLMPQRLAGWRAERPAVDAFASGVLAVVAASPCTAPFMGAALGYAITQSPAVALGVFAALGLGMALPYVALVLAPGWRERLPRPGAWMLTLKQLLAFPMFATVVWLVWVLGQQMGMDGAAKALLALVGLAFIVWLSGLASVRALAGRAAGAAGAIALAGLVVWTWPGAPSTAHAAAATAASPTGSIESAWQPYDEAAIARHAADGKPVFVDFTAAWCVTCQVNKRSTLNDPALMADLDAARVALLRADWTRRDATISNELSRLGRNGVPVYAIYRAGQGKDQQPTLLPELLSVQTVRDALALSPAKELPQ
jgi:thiol:disulfide interchange protein